jgi:hypothetical protein
VSVKTFQGKPVTIELRKEIFVTKLDIKRKLLLKNEVMGKVK